MLEKNQVKSKGSSLHLEGGPEQIIDELHQKTPQQGERHQQHILGLLPKKLDSDIHAPIVVQIEDHHLIPHKGPELTQPLLFLLDKLEQTPHRIQHLPPTETQQPPNVTQYVQEEEPRVVKYRNEEKGEVE